MLAEGMLDNLPESLGEAMLVPMGDHAGGGMYGYVRWR